MNDRRRTPVDDAPAARRWRTEERPLLISRLRTARTPSASAPRAADPQIAAGRAWEASGQEVVKSNWRSPLAT